MTEDNGSGLGDAQAAIDRYQSQIDEIEKQREELEQIDGRFGVARIVLFFLAIATWLFAAFADVSSWVTIAGWIAFGAFLVVVVVNEPYRDKLNVSQRQKSVLKRLIARLHRDWETLSTKRYTQQLADVPLSENQQAVSDDLDLLGKMSLFHFVSMAATTPGIRTLGQWLAGTADRNAAQERSTAAQKLAPLHDERLRFYTLSREIGSSSGDPDQFVKWSTGPKWLDSRMWLMTWANISVLITALLILVVLASAIGILAAPLLKYAGLALFILAALNLLLTGITLGPAHAIFSIAMSNRQSVSNYQELFGAAKQLPVGDADQGMLSRIHGAILQGDHSAENGMNELQKIASAGSMRQSALMFFAYVPLQAFGLWDVRVLKRLEEWQSKYAGDVPKWFEALGELEAVMSVAAVTDEYPNWSTPTWNDPSDQVIQATSIGHPLLPDGGRVCNDVSVGPPGTILLVTGSNMSGKSTMLRSLGLNVALAGVGAPVCATSMSLPSTQMSTSIRVRDNLGEGVSFYMAELQRLKSVVDHARKVAEDNDTVLLFLLDEILQGTNSRERQIAVVQVLRHLIKSKSIGAISTHDLELADDPDLLSLATTVHFRETIRPDAEGNEQMTFDYKMRQGVSPTTNALRLLEMVGLGED